MSSSLYDLVLVALCCRYLPECTPVEVESAAPVHQPEGTTLPTSYLKVVLSSLISDAVEARRITGNLGRDLVDLIEDLHDDQEEPPRIGGASQ